MFCGQYIDTSTAVYIDSNVFNYAEENQRLMKLDAHMIFGEITSCRWITMYTSCLSIYPHCNITTQALLAPCMNNCLNYTSYCEHQTNISSILTASGDKQFILNCSAPFTKFGTVNVDMDSCYEFNCKLIAIINLP